MPDSERLTRAHRALLRELQNPTEWSADEIGLPTEAAEMLIAEYRDALRIEVLSNAAVELAFSSNACGTCTTCDICDGASKLFGMANCIPDRPQGSPPPRFVVQEIDPRCFTVHDTVSQLNYETCFTRRAAQDIADRRTLRALRAKAAKTT